MKRVLPLIFLLALLFSVSAGAETLTHVADDANRLTASEKASLESQAQEVYDRTGFDIILHTTDDSQSKGPMDYSFDYYYAFRDVARYPDGTLLAIMFDTRDYYEAAHGKGIELLTHRESYDLGKVVQAKLSDGDVYGAMRDYVRYVRGLLIPPTPVEKAFEFSIFYVIGGLVIGLIYALILKSKLKIAKFQQGAAAYVIPNSLNLTQSEDIYLYQTVTRTKIETSSGGGGRSGGGFSMGSRGGSSFGGRGGKF
jgi:uncharacterized protein